MNGLVWLDSFLLGYSYCGRQEVVYAAWKDQDDQIVMKAPYVEDRFEKRKYNTEANWENATPYPRLCVGILPLFLRDLLR